MSAPWPSGETELNIAFGDSVNDMRVYEDRLGYLEGIPLQGPSTVADRLRQSARPRYAPYLVFFPKASNSVRDVWSFRCAPEIAPPRSGR